MSKPRFTRRAANDLEEIHAYIAENNPLNADDFVAQLLAVIEKLTDSPRIGVLRNDIAPNARVLPYKDYLIIYEAVGNDVRIDHIVHGARDLPNLPSPSDS